MPGPAGQHTLILQQERATKKVTGLGSNRPVRVSHGRAVWPFSGHDLDVEEGVDRLPLFVRSGGGAPVDQLKRVPMRGVAFMSQCPTAPVVA
jgi:hypothetical protein